MISTMNNASVGSVNNASDMPLMNQGDHSFVCETEGAIFVLEICVLSLAIIIGSIGNALTLVSVMCLPGMKRSMNWLIANISVADSIVCIYLLPTIFANRFACHNVSSASVCTANALIMLMCTGVSNTTFMLIAINRHLYVLNRSTYIRVFSERRITMYCALTWVFWLLISLLMYYLDAFYYAEMAFACFYFAPNTLTVVSFIYTLVAVILPTSIAGVSYFSLFKKILKIRIRALRADNVNSFLEKLRLFDKEKWGVISALVASGLFNICWGPYTIHIYLAYFQVHISGQTHRALMWMSIISSALNPIVYCALNTQFRQAFKSIVHLKSAHQVHVTNLSLGIIG